MVYTTDMVAKDTGTLKNAEEEPRYQEEKVLFSWNAQARPFKRQTREFYVTAVSIAVLFGLILFLIDGLMPVLLIIAFCFLFYVLHNVEPERAEYKITTFGVRVADRLTIWDNVLRFWFSERMGSEVLVLETAGLIGRFELIVDKKDKETIKKIVKKYVIHEEAEPSILDKSANWVAGKLQQ